MKLLLTSNGITNNFLKTEFLNLCGGSMDGKSCVFIPTASTIYPGNKSWVLDGMNKSYALGDWSAFDILDLATEGLDHINRLEDADVIIAWGGSEYYLNYWLTKRLGRDKLAELLDSKVWVGASAGGMVLGKSINYQLSGKIYGEYTPDEVLDENFQGFVDFAVLPHYGSDEFAGTGTVNMEKCATEIGCEVYLLDDDSAVTVEGVDVRVVGEGMWKLVSNISK